MLSMWKAKPRAVWRSVCKSVVEAHITATRARPVSRAAGGTPLGRWKTGRRVVAASASIGGAGNRPPARTT